MIHQSGPESGWEIKTTTGSRIDDSELPVFDSAENLLSHYKDGQPSLDLDLSPSSSSAAAQITPPPHFKVRRQNVVATDVDLIVEDGSGSTIGEVTLQGLPTAPTDVSLPIGILTIPALVNSPPVISLPVDDLNTNSPGSPSPTSSPSLSIQVPDSSSQVVISSPPTPAPSDSTFSPFPISTATASGSGPFSTSNSTTSTSSPGTISSLSSQTTNSTSSISSTTQSTLVTLTSSHLSSTSSTSRTSSSPSALSTGVSATTTSGGGVGAGGGTATSGPPSATSSSAAAAASSTTPTYVPVVGGVLGGLAGLALLLVAALFFLRWYKRRQRAAGRLGAGDDESAPPGTSHSGAPMAQNPVAPWGAAALGPLMRRMRPHSMATAATTDTGTSERGFQKISGRKIESVLVSGGDGYGGRGPGAGNLSGQSFYRDSTGTYGGGDSQNSSMIVGPASPRKSAATSDFTDMSGIAGPSSALRASDKEVVTMRPSPARQPVTTSPGYALSSPGNQAVPPTDTGSAAAPSQRLQRPDPLGRSRPSHDGSRGSKFAEDLK